MDVWNIFSIERRSAFLRFRLVDDDDFDDVLSGEKRSSMVDSEDFGEEDIALKKEEQKNVVVVVVVVVVKAFKKQHVVVSTKHNRKGKRKRCGRHKERENIYDFWRFFGAFFLFHFSNDKSSSLVTKSFFRIVNANI